MDSGHTQDSLHTATGLARGAKRLEDAIELYSKAEAARELGDIGCDRRLDGAAHQFIRLEELYARSEQALKEMRDGKFKNC